LKNNRHLKINYFILSGLFEVWDDKAHADLIKTLKTAFSSWWVKPLENNWSTTLEEVWTRTGLPADQGRLILTYSVIGIYVHVPHDIILKILKTRLE